MSEPLPTVFIRKLIKKCSLAWCRCRLLQLLSPLSLLSHSGLSWLITHFRLKTLISPLMRLYWALTRSRQLQRGYRLWGSHHFLFYFISFLMCWEETLDVIGPVSHNRDDKTLIIMNNVVTHGEPGSHYCDRYSALFSRDSSHLGFLLQ